MEDLILMWVQKKDGTVGLFHVHHENVVIHTRLCISQHCFLLIFSIFGPLIAKLSLESEGPGIGLTY
jgi:hypothetical protein